MKSPEKRVGRILVVDDEEGVRTFLAETLERSGHDVTQAADGAAAVQAAREEPFDVVLTDLRMPGTDGMTVVRTVRTEQPDVEVIVLTAFGDVATAVEAMKLGAFDYLEKPVSGPAAIRELVAGALERRTKIAAPSHSEPAAAAKLSGPPSPNARLTFGAPAMRPVVDALARVAKTGATVLLQGESGTGKEVAARLLHETSPRARRPFIAINCAVLTDQLLESELFGHEKGAFTGAHAQRRGRIELAEGGTFFLDEVGELKPGLQAKLLRVLEERQFERLGGSTPVVADVRWVAATNRDLRTMAQEGTFREDLYHRLAVFPIRLPPLRERREDIVPLAESLIAQLSTSGRAGERRTPLRLDDAAKERLRLCDWPGNVRELRNALERAIILTDGPVIQLEHLWIEESSVQVGPATPLLAPDEGSLAELERQTIQRTLAAVGGNRRLAATKLGIGLRTLYEKLKRYDLRG
ncbi:MAG TPA: sigma-54 dependent transcriptional regulator [Polyangiaceae bacterium]|nr:sigma-54 dependent transcriptional regulator [Polyangiaceae bacterium]